MVKYMNRKSTFLCDKNDKNTSHYVYIHKIYNIKYKLDSARITETPLQHYEL